ncbi:MAG: hypothetical protein WAK55_06535 [Xanthobacteraceae bacterium]
MATTVAKRYSGKRWVVVQSIDDYVAAAPRVDYSKPPSPPPPKTGTEPRIVSVRQARRMLGDCSVHTFWQIVRAGYLEIIGGPASMPDDAA